MINITTNLINKKITFGDKELIIENIYPYMYTNGKVVLRVSAKEENVSESDLKQLKDNQLPIIYYEQTVTTDDDENTTEISEWIEKITYDDYTTGEYMSSYLNGIYSCEITRLGEFEKTIQQNTADIKYLSIMSDIEI